MLKRTHRRDDVEDPGPYAGYALPYFTTRDHSRDNVIDALHALPPVVYYVRVQPGLVKIGYSTNLHRRLSELGVEREALLMVVPGTLETEREHHRRWAAHLVRGREWFRECEEILSYVNTVRDSYGVPDAA